MGDTYETEDVTRWGPDVEVLGPILGSLDRRKNGNDEISGMVSSYVSFDGTNDGNLEGVVPGEGNKMVVLEGNGYGIKLGIYDGEVMGTTLGYVYGLKLGGKEVSYQRFSDSFLMFWMCWEGYNNGSLLTDYLCMSRAWNMARSGEILYIVCAYFSHTQFGVNWYI